MEWWEGKKKEKEAKKKKNATSFLSASYASPYAASPSARTILSERADDEKKTERRNLLSDAV